MTEQNPFDALEAEYVKKVDDLQAEKARGNLTADWGEASLSSAILTLRDIRYAKCRYAALSAARQPEGGGA